MAPRRPPDILRKSHAHSDGKERARARQSLRDELSASDAGPEAALLVDLDGVVYVGDRAIDGAADAIAWLRAQSIPHLFVTNTTSRPRDAIAERLAGFGLRVEAREILTPPVAAADWLEQAGCRRLALFVPAATRREFSGFDQADASTESGVDAVVIGDYGEGWSFAELNRAFRLLMSEPRPKLIALGMTRYWLASDGLRLDTAPFVVALSHASGVEPVVLGKPAEAFFSAALDRLGVAAASAWMVGDDIRADVGGAEAAGLRGVLVRSGKFRPADLELGIEPAIVLDSIADLPAEWGRVALHTGDDSR